MGNSVRVRPGSGHPNWCGCAGCRRDIAATETSLLKLDAAMLAGCALFAGAAWVVLAPLRIWHRAGADGHMHPVTATWIAYGTGGAVLLACLMFFSIRAAGKANRQAALRVPPAMPPAPPLPRPRVRPPVAAPACRHLDAVPVDNLLGGEPWAWLCPLPPEGCGERLPAEHGRLMRPCCGSAPGTLHQYNCPHLKGSPS